MNNDGPEMPEQESSVERVRAALYRRGATSKVHKRRELSVDEEQPHVQGQWGGESGEAFTEGIEQDPDAVLGELNQKQQQRPKPTPLSEYSMTPRQIATYEKKKLAVRFVKTLFAASALFFVLAAGYATYTFWWGPTQVGCEKVKIDHVGPLTIASGKEMVLNVNITNDNPTALQNAQLVVEYPEGARSADSPSTQLPSERKDIGTLEPGESIRTVARAILFGSEQDELVINTAVQYNIEGSNHDFYCERPHRIVIATAPVNVEVDGIEEISSNQEIELVVTVSSNSEQTVPEVRLIVDYPYGFDPIAAEPTPTAGDSVWDLGDIEPGTEHTIILHGFVTGIGTEARRIQFSIGEMDKQDETRIATVLQKIEHPLLVTRPFLDLNLLVNNDTGPVISLDLGEAVQGTLEYKNNLDYALHDIKIEAKLPGVIVDPGSVRVDKGYFRSVDSTMLWTPQTNNKLLLIEPGETGILTFNFNTYKFIEGTGADSPNFDIAFDVEARRISDNVPVQQNLTAQSRRTLKFISDIDFTAETMYAIGPFSNVGPYPPRVNEETTYTVMFSIANTTNDIEDAVVVGQLPVYVTWLNVTHPDNENISYNPVSRELTWEIGDLKAGAGYDEPDRTIYYHVSFIPSITQVGKTPLLVENLMFTGVDQFTGDVIEQKGPRVTTVLKNDPFFPGSTGQVGE